jgi:hypothetical protein
MAWIEARKKQYRVYWRTPTGRPGEPFKSHSAAQRFMALAEALNHLGVTATTQVTRPNE